MRTKVLHNISKWQKTHQVSLVGSKDPKFLGVDSGSNGIKSSPSVDFKVGPEFRLRATSTRSFINDTDGDAHESINESEVRTSCVFAIHYLL